jgi:hypothetical protein
MDKPKNGPNMALENKVKVWLYQVKDFLQNNLLDLEEYYQSIVGYKI